MAIPLRAQFSNFIGYILCMWASIQDSDSSLLQSHDLFKGLFSLAYTTGTSGNLRISPSYVLFYPFPRPCTHLEQLSQELFNLDGTLYNQTLILNSNLEVDPTLLDEVGLVCHLFDLNVAYRLPLLGAALLRRILGRPTAHYQPWIRRHLHPFTALEFRRPCWCLELVGAF